MLALTDRDGRVVAADPSGVLELSLASESYVRAAQESSELVVSDLLLAPGRTAPWFAVARAVHRPNGDVAGVLIAYMDAAKLGDALRLDRLGRAGYAILDRRLQVVYDSQHPDPTWAQRDAAGLPHVRTAAQGQAATSEGFTSPIDGTRRLGAAAPVPRLDWVVTADRLLAEALRPIEDAARYEAAFSALIVLLALMVALVLAVTLTDRLRKLEWAMAAVRQGDYGKRVSVGGRDELTELADGFNEMMARLEALEQEREAFAAMVAHDLRSPLTTVRGTAQLLARRPPSEPALQQGLATIVRESDRVARLAADLGDAQRAAVGRLEIRPQQVDVATLVAQAVDRLRAGRASQPIQLDADPGPLWVDADPERIAQVLDNLLGNAAKYSPPDEPIRVQVRGGGEARVCVEDRGAGIAPEDLPHVFDRFYRTRLAKDGPVAGTGLGLYISQEIAQAHHGRITVESTPGQGSRFTLYLPRTSTPASAVPST